MTRTASPPLSGSPLSVNALTQPLVQRLVEGAEQFKVSVSVDPSGVRIVDAGIEAPGCITAGLLVGEICMGGLGQVSLRPGTG